MEVRPFSAAEGEHMSHRLLRRCVTAGVLAAVLLGATPAHARDLGTARSAWLWFQDAWTQGVSAFWDRMPVPAGQGVRDQRKEGNGLDPNGGTPPRPNSAPEACGLCSESRQSLDPNG